MTGRVLLSAVACGLLFGVGLTEPLEAGQKSPAAEPGQAQAEAQDPEALRLAAEQGDAEAQYSLVAFNDAADPACGPFRLIREILRAAGTARWR